MHIAQLHLRVGMRWSSLLQSALSLAHTMNCENGISDTIFPDPHPFRFQPVSVPGSFTRLQVLAWNNPGPRWWCWWCFDVPQHCIMWWLCFWPVECIWVSLSPVLRGAVLVFVSPFVCQFGIQHHPSTLHTSQSGVLSSSSSESVAAVASLSVWHFQFRVPVIHSARQEATGDVFILTGPPLSVAFAVCCWLHLLHLHCCTLEFPFVSKLILFLFWFMLGLLTPLLRHLHRSDMYDEKASQTPLTPSCDDTMMAVQHPERNTDILYTWWWEWKYKFNWYPSHHIAIRYHNI